MTPEPNQQIKLYFRNGHTLDGIVVSWIKNNYVLRSLDSNSICIISNPDEDVWAIKILVTNKEQISKIEQCCQQIEQKPPIVQELNKEENYSCKEEIKEPLTFNNLNIKKLAELRIALANQEREIIANKLKSHSIEGVKQTQYGLPGFLKSNVSK